ncbi:VWA domain-containing protein [Streptomyces sp. NPDC053253]|uniref:VWA domain-containing protein n=1 Tax=Streptomyces sp. NPDC053253 TaxID=3365699 RepID=UPI0037D70A88
MLRKVFGRDREDTPATSVPAQTREASSTDTSASVSAAVSADTATDTATAAETVTSASTGTEEAAARRAADDLVAASFDNPQVPKARSGESAGEATETSVEPAETAVEPAVEAEAAETVVEAEAAEAAVEVEASEPASASEPATVEEPAEAPAAVTVEAEEPVAATVEAEEPVAATVEAPEAEASAATAEAEEPAATTVEAPEAETSPATVEAEEPAAATVEAEEPAAAAVDAEERTEPEAEPAAVADTAPAEPEAVPEAVVAVDAPEEQEGAAEPAAEVEAVAAEAQVAEADTDTDADTDTEAATDTDTEAATDTDTETGTGTPALTLAKVKAAAPHLADAYKAAGAQLKKQGLTGARAAVYLVVDRSGSMRGYFKDGSVQRLAEQTVALAAHLDEDATVTTVFFSTDIDGTVDLAPADLTPTRVEEVNGTLGRLGRTNYHRAVEEVLAHHEKADPTRPALVVFQTDGAPESKTAATQALAEAADRPLHWRFVAWGEEDNKAFDFLRKLDGTPRTAAYFPGATPVETAHPAFYRGLLDGLEF